MRRAVLTIALVLMLAPLGAQAALPVTQNPHGDLRWDCQECHTAESWSQLRDSLVFSHDETGFSLRGAHASARCAGCHTDLVFSRAESKCAGCHDDIHQGHLGTDCASCHNPYSWLDKDALFDRHAARGFALTGVHAVTDCDACHLDQQPRDFAGTSAECQSCHNDDFAVVTEPNHIAAGFSAKCESCHGRAADTWANAIFEHPVTFPLIDGHANVTCNTCHAETYAGTSAGCVSCHEKDYTDTKDPDHVGSEFSRNCNECHTILAWSPAEFDHTLARFTLTGAHLSADCARCHAEQYTGTPSACVACHEPDVLAASDPNHEEAGFPKTCAVCHSTDAWKPSHIDHDLTRFVLSGAHVGVDCSSCHTAGYTGTSSECYACHNDDFAAVEDPNHVTHNFSHECVPCHNTTAWLPAEFDHNLTEFPLTGAHTSAECGVCHTSGYDQTSTACYACHASDYAGAEDPDHPGNRFDHDCAACHTTKAWRPAEFDHNLTDFPLTGAHVEVNCVSCHGAGYTGTATACFDCHKSDYNAVADPDHAGSGFDRDCQQCHTTATWLPAEFDHDLADFKLTGAHAAVACNSCHVGGFTGTPMECFACHEQDYNDTDNPNHTLTGLDHDCALCHTTSAWQPSSFDHNATDFPLTGAHAGTACNLCHAGTTAGLATECYACHESDYAGTVDPDHVGSHFPAECGICHTTAAWRPSHIDHNLTSFPLTGAHAVVDCNSCHAGGYTGTPSDCYACHNNDFANVDDPDHVQGGFDHNCTVCHTTDTWLPATFDHNLTNFPLAGAHAATGCNSCHADGYNGTPTQCFACHESDYNATVDPDHVGSGLPTTCGVCHSVAAWRPSHIDHNLTGFPLTGAHVSVDCATCHTTGYTGTPSDCFACHQADYAGVSDPDHAGSGFDHDCAQCHTTGAWRPAEFDHNLASFKLTGAHAAVDCASCHTTGYTGTPQDCFACHNSDYASASDPDHAANGFDHECTVCHNTDAWQPATFDHNLTAFPLTGAHAATNCVACHSGGYAGTPIACFACHESDFNGTTDPNHVANNFGHNCAACHNTFEWQPADFNHNQTSFPLLGAHLAVNCVSCHTAGYTNTPLDCIACHETDFNGVSDPNHVANNFDHGCTRCHSMNGWTPSTFDHNLTAFPLTGAHTATQCVDCHTQGYAGTPSDCFACHESDFNGTTDPDHVANNFGHTCAVCHNTNAWQPADFDHNRTSFPLLGAHLAVECGSCHTTGYTNTPSDCMACHESDFAGVGDPDHVTNNFDHYCLACHSMNGWTPSTFDHNQIGFALTGAHATMACIDCHGSGYAGTPTDCYACHAGGYNGVSDPNHLQSGFDHSCTQCHTTDAWQPADYDHNLSQFTLAGAHLAVACAQCHTNGYTGTAMDCLACHSSNYNGAGNPSHAANNFDHDCTRCHSMNGWTPSTFNHSQTSFPLTGAHTTTLCIDCHSAGYIGTPMECFACHESDFNGTTDPNHVANNFGHNCTACHNTNAWQPADFDHNQTGFPLLGAHLAVTCASCHTAGYTNTPSDCFACHAGDYNGVGDPSHTANNFDHDCTQCHSMNGWTPATFNHNETAFPLTGAHTTTTCIECHGSGYAGTPTDCYACHVTDYNNVTDPNHVQGGFSHDCRQCHTTNGWEPADYDHNLSQFKLTGAHLAVACVQCHAGGYTGTPMDCVACHDDDYLATTNPSHAAAGFPTDCESCHSTDAWTPADWDHDGQYFPIYSGAHRGRWNDCTDCHNVPANFAQFECILCHTHDRSTTDSHHTSVRNYSYVSTACYDCHPTGRAGD